MVNNSDNLYARLARLFRYIERNQGVSIIKACQDALILVIEDQHWRIKDYFQKMVNDGVIVVTQDGMIYTTTYKLNT